MKRRDMFKAGALAIAGALIPALTAKAEARLEKTVISGFPMKKWDIELAGVLCDNRTGTTYKLGTGVDVSTEHGRARRTLSEWGDAFARKACYLRGDEGYEHCGDQDDMMSKHESKEKK